METWEIVARESIRDLVARYNANGDSGRFDPLLELFCESAVMVLPDGQYQGKGEIRRMFERVAQDTGRDSGSRARFIRHFTSTLQIDLAGPNEASSRCYYAVLTDQGLDHWGRYVDRYQCVENDWLFSHRNVTVDAGVPGGWGMIE